MSKQTYKAPAERRRAQFATNLRDCIPGNVTVVNNFEKPNGNWMLLLLPDGQSLMEDLGAMVAEHNDAVKGIKGASRIFVGDAVAVGANVEFLPTIKIGIKNKCIAYAA